MTGRTSRRGPGARGAGASGTHRPHGSPHREARAARRFANSRKDKIE